MVGTSMSTAGQVHAEEIVIVRLAVALGALKVGGPLSAEEKRLATKALTLAKPTRVEIRQAREAISAACDPLGDRIIAARSQPSAGNRLETTTALRRVINLPSDLDELEPSELRAIKRFLKGCQGVRCCDGYVARNRKAWWSVGLREPAPILATYMARRAPAFVRNVADARHINIAHGLYPLMPLPDAALDRLAVALRESESIGLGRTYAGGLVKFEPREMERIPVPSIDQATTVLLDPDLLYAARYLAGPPISVDDLTILSNASLSATQIGRDPASSQRIIATILL